METVTLTVQERKETGKRATKEVRKAGLIPCVLYGKDEVVHFSVKTLDVRALIYTPDFKLCEISLGGKSYSCIVKDIDFHPVTDAITHIDFLKLIPGQSLKAEIPIRFRGVAPGVKTGGILSPNLRKVKIKTVPENLASEFFVDISTLELGQSVRVKDIETPEGVEVLNSPNIPVASVETPRSLRSAASAEEEDGVVEDGEVEEV